ncbi:endo-beta-1,3-galactanase [Fistulina hepatica ATCC 64428]|uniref:Endo-beta-1,3-galactanase n=1 Tax=Fistulina hepatica ATCC 64428 TaxID=1128425 RepID=A0A0D7A4M0_9AGAR|nr:endo-beta-1,3-galactanase [Fistulina hepatica ATCC 64428]
MLISLEIFPILLVSFFATTVRADTTVIPSSSFEDVSTFEQYWSYLYPWGTDHNGSARMNKTQVIVASSTLSLIATPTSNASPPSSTADPYYAIHYKSGTVYAKDYVTVTADNSYTVYGEFSSPTEVGTWPAFWLTAVESWPPEADIGEWKGTANNWYNTFNTSSEVASTLVAWPTDLSFHSLQAVLSAESNDEDVRIDFYMDGELKATQYGEGFVGAALYLIIDLQMEGSSGTPGPTGTTTYKIRNVSVTKTGD